MISNDDKFLPPLNKPPVISSITKYGRQIDVEASIRFPLYRFTKKKWADAFMNTGQLRLGTIFDYATNELYCNEVGDMMEGIYVKRGIGITGEPTFECISARNNLTLCFADRYDERFYKWFDADACLKITSIDFFVELDFSLHQSCTPLLLRKVTYYNKNRWDCVPKYNDFAGVMKDSSFMHQCEIRALWESDDYNISHHGFDITNKELDRGPLEGIANLGSYQKRIAKEAKELKPMTLCVPNARSSCELIYKKANNLKPV
jgi:hypothetical protein